MNRGVPIMLGASLATIMLGAVLLCIQVADHLAHPLAIDSNAGLTVFRLSDGQLVSYGWFDPDPGATVLRVGVVLLAGTLFVGAATWRGRRGGHPPRS